MVRHHYKIRGMERTTDQRHRNHDNEIAQCFPLVANVGSSNSRSQYRLQPEVGNKFGRPRGPKQTRLTSNILSDCMTSLLRWISMGLDSRCVDVGLFVAQSRYSSRMMWTIVNLSPGATFAQKGSLLRMVSEAKDRTVTATFSSACGRTARTEAASNKDRTDWSTGAVTAREPLHGGVR